MSKALLGIDTESYLPQCFVIIDNKTKRPINGIPAI